MSRDPLLKIAGPIRGWKIQNACQIIGMCVSGCRVAVLLSLSQSLVGDG